jgi:hypothetical protein
VRWARSVNIHAGSTPPFLAYPRTQDKKYRRSKNQCNRTLSERLLGHLSHPRRQIVPAERDEHDD